MHVFVFFISLQSKGRKKLNFSAKRRKNIEKY